MGFFPDGRIRDIDAGSSADKQGLKRLDCIFAINNINCIGEDGAEMERLVKDSGSSVKIGLLGPKKFDTNRSK